MNENHNNDLGGFGLVVGAIMGAGLWAAIILVVMAIF